MKYVLITAARNEEKFIERTIKCVVGQTIRPLKWIIVSNGSTDRTEEIVQNYIADNPWIELVITPGTPERNFTAKAQALNQAYAGLKGLPFEVVGNLDSDISFENDYFEFLLSQFHQDDRLGIAGTPYIEIGKDVSDRIKYDTHYVHGQCQLFRRACFEQIGGYLPHKLGGLDVIAVNLAKMKGWTVRSFKEKKFIHHRQMNSAYSKHLLVNFKDGQKDYFLGNHPLWEALRVCYQLSNKPYVIRAVLLCAGYLWMFLTRYQRPVDRQFVKFRQKEQLRRIVELAKNVRL
jgi:poly-beta-1,6-N-acetyl-D-glucosamine synthase